MNSEQQVNEAIDAIKPLRSWLNDPDIVEIMIDGPQRVTLERQGKGMEDFPSPFADEAELVRFAKAITAPLGREVGEEMPLMDARLPDGSRVNIVMPPISLMNGPIITIRKFAAKPLRMDDLLRFGALDQTIVEFLQACIRGRLNVVVSGGTGSGKTTVMNILASLIPERERVITVESAAELQLQHGRVLSLETRPPNAEGKGEITVQDLVINALKMRPDRIIMGEARGPEVIDILQAMNTGHDGTMFTIHANSPRDVVARLETMAAMANLSIPLLTIRAQLASAIQLITQQDRLADGTRKITKISEVVGMQGDAIDLQDIFEFRQTGMADNGRIQGQFMATGYIPKFLQRLNNAGQQLPLSLFQT